MLETGVEGGALLLGAGGGIGMWSAGYHADGGYGIFAFDGGVEDGVGFVVPESPHGRGGVERMML